MSDAVYHAELKVLARVVRGETPEPEADTITEACPFKSPEAFTEENHRFLCGRRAVTQRLVEHLRTRRFLAVPGPSGSGKSSVGQAGLAPPLRERGDDIALFTPANRPVMELAFALCGLYKAATTTTSPKPIPRNTSAAPGAPAKTSSISCRVSRPGKSHQNSRNPNLTEGPSRSVVV